jgi:chromosome segregation ATPase
VDFASLQASVQEYESKCKDLADELERIMQERDAQAEDVIALKSKCEAAEALSSESDTTVTAMKQQLEELRLEHENARTAMSTLTLELSTKEAEWETKRSELEKEMNDLKSNLDAVVLERDGLAIKCKESEGMLDMTVGQHDSRFNAIREERDNLLTELAALEVTLSTERANAAEMSQQLEDMRVDYDHFQHATEEIVADWKGKLLAYWRVRMWSHSLACTVSQYFSQTVPMDWKSR